MFSINDWKIKRITKKIRAMQATRENNQPTSQIIQKEKDYYFELAAIYKKLLGHKKYPFAEVMRRECYRAAAELEDSKAHFQLAQILIAEGNYRQELDHESIFNSSENLKAMTVLYEEAQAHLLAAMQLGNVDAKRLRGLSIISGWGVESDKKTGFDLIVESIEEEGSWERVPQIFASMGLNKPEFFAAITQRRKI